MKTEIETVTIQVQIDLSELKSPLNEIKSLKEQLYNSHSDFLEVMVDDLGPFVLITVKVIFNENLSELKQLVSDKVQEVFSPFLKPV